MQTLGRPDRAVAARRGALRESRQFRHRRQRRATPRDRRRPRACRKETVSHAAGHCLTTAFGRRVATGAPRSSLRTEASPPRVLRLVAALRRIVETAPAHRPTRRKCHAPKRVSPDGRRAHRRRYLGERGRNSIVCRAQHRLESPGQRNAASRRAVATKRDEPLGTAPVERECRRNSATVWQSKGATAWIPSARRPRDRTITRPGEAAVTSGRTTVAHDRRSSAARSARASSWASSAGRAANSAGSELVPYPIAEERQVTVRRVIDPFDPHVARVAIDLGARDIEQRTPHRRRGAKGAHSTGPGPAQDAHHDGLELVVARVRGHDVAPAMSAATRRRKRQRAVSPCRLACIETAPAFAPRTVPRSAIGHRASRAPRPAWPAAQSRDRRLPRSTGRAAPRRPHAPRACSRTIESTPPDTASTNGPPSFSEGFRREVDALRGRSRGTVAGWGK